MNSLQTVFLTRQQMEDLETGKGIKAGDLNLRIKDTDLRAAAALATNEAITNYHNPDENYAEKTVNALHSIAFNVHRIATLLENHE